MNRLLFLLFTLFLISNILSGQPANRSALSIEQIMQGDKFVGYLPENIRWGEDSRTIYFTWNPEQESLRSLYKVSVGGGQPQKVSVAEQMQLPSAGNRNRTGTLLTYERDGDIFLLDKNSGKTLQITNTTDQESDPAFSGDESRIIFSRDNNLYTWEIATGTLVQLTNLRRGNKRAEPSYSPQEQWLRDDQLEWMEVVRARKETQDLRRERSKALEPKQPREIYYGDKQVSNLQASPDLRFITFRLNYRTNSHNTAVPNYVTESGYTEDLSARPKVGSPNDGSDFGIYDAQIDTFYTLDTKQIPGIYDKPEFLKEYHRDTTAYNPKYTKPREVVVHGPVYASDGKALLVVRSFDNKDRWILLLNPSDGSLRLLDRQHDEAWIGGPGIGGWTFAMGNIGWMPDNNNIWFQSEATGYSQLYTLNVTTGERKVLTSGSWEVLDAQLSQDHRYFYISANAEGPHEQHFYRLPAEGGVMERLTTTAGGYEVTLSPDEKYLAIRYSYSNKPWELYVMENKPGAAPKQLTHSTTKAFAKYKWREPEIVWFTAADGAKVPARLYRSAKGGKKGPGVIFVHGAGYLQNVHQWWSSYFREYMFNNLLADNGYTVLDIDYRASSGYGRDWRTSIYRHMGGKDLSDQVDGARYLVSQGVDARKIGLYGGSYGGFITLMAMFNAPETFASGAALRSVTDWAHYNHPYTSNILNLPVEDSIAYRRSSPIYFAEGLRGRLLMLHGMVDTNVQFQDIVRLTQRFIELGKNNWELAVFPMEDHGFVEPSSWTDEYKRIFKLFQETLSATE